jgi:glutamine synthetase
MADEMDFELEGIHTETGPGALEACLSVDSGLVSADKAALFKTFSKVLCQRQELMATFMAKWSPDYPGQSGHLHQSLWHTDGTSAFFDGNKKKGMSDICRHYLAGQLQLLPFVLPMVAPTINSYTRMIKGYWAPTHSNWGHDNRTCAIRYISGSEKSTRLEYRIAAADGNPYIALAAAVATGLYGIKNKLEPFPKVNGNAYDLDTSPTNPELPKNLQEAISEFNQNKIIHEIFGSKWVNHFTITREWESKVYNEEKKSELDWYWMLNRYFEII